MLIIYLILILTVLVSGSLIFIIKSENQNVLKLVLAFSGAFLIGISFMKLVPEVFSTSAKYAGLFVVLGFLIQLLLELVTEGIEHGHSHEHRENEKVAPFVLLTGLCLHAFLEGAPLSMDSSDDLRHSLVTGIVVHNIPISFALMSLLIHYGCSRARAFVFLAIFAVMSPLGSIVSNLIPFASSGSMQHFFTYSLAVVIGIFLHVSTAILFETGDNHRYNIQKFVTVCFGILIACILGFL
jgi:zinc and cadmium transporter